MAGARKFALNYISRDDLCALTREASEVSGISYVMDGDKEEVENILRKVDKSEKTSSNIINLNIEALIKSKALRAQ
ncbi:MAG: hypothetical protein KGZ49_06990 [Syntrophaceae bacterium]|nr:hypothetical protein [Syntrophaceae bacterium]